MTDQIPRSLAASFELFLMTQPGTVKLSKGSIEAMRRLFHLGALAHENLTVFASTLPPAEAAQLLAGVTHELETHFALPKRPIAMARRRSTCA
jgi:hypothetical protein